MRLFLVLIYILASVVCFAQTSVVNADTLWIHRMASTEDEDLDSYFPLLKCKAKPALAERINKTLQMEELGFVLNEQRKASLQKQPENVDERLNVIFTISYPNSRLIIVDIGRFERTTRMALSGNYKYQRHYFDAVTGDPVYLKSFFTEDGFVRLNAKVTALLRKSFIETMKKYTPEFTASGEKAFDEECGCNCTKNIDHSFCNGSGSMDFLPGGGITYSINSCHWMDPGNPDDHYTASFTAEQIRPLLSEYGKYLTAGGTYVTSSSPFYRVWKGNIGGKIPVTFILYASCSPGDITGLEVYDKFGTSIKMGGTFSNNRLKISELTADGNPVAIVEATLQEGKLIGSWTKADKSKTLAFEAVIANLF